METNSGGDVDERTMKKARLGEEMDEVDDDLKGLSAAELTKRLMEERKRLMEQRKRSRNLDENLSVKLVLGSMPRMKENPANKPAIIPNEIAHQRVTAYREKLSKYREDLAAWNSKKSSSRPKPPERLNFHEPAEIQLIDLSIELFDGFEVHVADGAGKLIKSRLSQEAVGSLSFDKDRRRSMSHHNETSPQDYLAMAMKDAIECCGFLGQLSVVKEATLFSLRPDLLVVMVEGRLLFVVEVKNPSGQEGLQVFESETAGGQTLDYLKALKQQGIDWPFAMLSTYNESIIARFPNDEQKYNEIFQKGSENANKCPSNRHRKDQSESCDKPPSLSKTAFCMKLPSIQAQASLESPPVLEEDNEEELATSYNYKERKVIYSQVFNVDYLFKALVLVLESSLESLSQSKQRSDPLLPNEGSSILETELCTLYDQGFSYEKVSINNVTYSKEPQVSKMKKYHVLCQVGQGGSTKTLLCSSSLGNLFAVKLFLISVSTLYSKKDRKVEESKEFKRKYEEAGEECKMWRRLEPRYQGFCHVVTLNGMPAMTMPYFPPVPYEQRKTALDLIKRRLEYVAEQGFYYNNDDLGWQHIGCRWTGEQMEIALLHLGSLGKEKRNLDGQVEKLQKWRIVEDNIEAKPVLVK